MTKQIFGLMYQRHQAHLWQSRCFAMHALPQGFPFLQNQLASHAASGNVMASAIITLNTRILVYPCSSSMAW